MEIKFNSIKDCLDFIKKALYMTDKKAFIKFLKWKHNDELVVEGDSCSLILPDKTKVDKDFNITIKSKYDTWISTNKTRTI